MKEISSFPRVSLGILPTPMHHLENLSRILGRNIYIKRDDMTGVSLGGNKVRKLEFLMAEARAQGADTVLTTGGAQSNHAMLTAACAARLGMKAILVLKKRGVFEKRGNQVLDELLGADVRFVDTDDYADIYREMERICADLESEGRKGYCIPVGGSVPLGTLGYVNCVREIAAQAEKMRLRMDHIICAVGSGGTHAGIALGAKLYLPQARVTGMMVDTDPFERIVPELMRKTAALLGCEEEIGDFEVALRDMTGPGYAIPSEAGGAAMRELARSEGVILDPVYSGKAFAGLLEMCRSGEIGTGENVLFVHTGGAGGVFAMEA